MNLTVIILFSFCCVALFNIQIITDQNAQVSDTTGDE